MMLARKAETQAQAFTKIITNNPPIKKATRGSQSGWLFDGSLMIFVFLGSLHYRLQPGNVTALKLIVLPLGKKADEKAALFICFHDICYLLPDTFGCS